MVVYVNIYVNLYINFQSISMSKLPLLPDNNTKYILKKIMIYCNGCIWRDFRNSSTSVDESAVL